jgi:DUF4097 and DUF4098 domain-containing protein YvlB
VDTEGHTVREEKRFTVTGRPELTLVTFDGAIEIRGWDRSEIRVEIEKRGSTPEMVAGIAIEAEQSGNRVRVEARKPAGSDPLVGFNLSRSARLVASVPAGTNLLARSGDGQVSIERVNGRIELRTSDGAIRGTDLAGDITVSSGDGAVHLDSVSGRLDARTDDGGVTAAGRLGAARIRSGDGAISLQIEAGSVMTDDWAIETGDGGVVVYLPDGFGAELDAETIDGRVRADDILGLAPAVEREADDDRSRLRGRLGAGGHLLRVRTADGSISLRRR